MNKKIIFVDIDGTLTDDLGNISSDTIEEIKAFTEEGGLVVLISGRNTSYAIDLSKKIGASEYVISSNGNEIYNYKTKTTIYFNEISYDKILDIYRTTENNQMNILLNACKNRYTNTIREGYTYINERDLENIRVSQISIYSNDKEKTINVKNQIVNKHGLQVAYQSKSFFEEKNNSIYLYDICKTNSSKGLAVVKLCQYLKIDVKDTVVIGDNHNDISMFQLDSYKVAMTNAIDEIKELSDCITMSNNDDGVAYFIKKLRLKK
ncbi:MAG: Cof-type HAD-IIB family hydrolase [Bacilli bacterium]|nr:Cof-type HAD-IIB family hydrolase [Bacilli bacterium]